MQSITVNLKSFSLETQEQRSAFARMMMRKRGITVDTLRVATGLAWRTVARYLDLHKDAEPTRNPATNTTFKIFNALGIQLKGYISK